eukprot:2547382-Prymnesium_polylepis.1
MLRETDGTWDNGYTQFVRPSGHVGSCIARRPAFSHARCSPPASAVSRRERAAHGRLRLTRHDGERDGGSVMA